MKIKITELFIAQADKFRHFYGTITRNLDKDGDKTLHGKIYVKNDNFDAIVYSMDNDQDALGKKMDGSVKSILDSNILKKNKKRSEIVCGNELNLN